jgi:ketosteroid isomerase-like protein
MDKINSEIKTAIDHYIDTWNRMAYDQLRDHWDPDEIEPFYIAEEMDAPIYGWPDIEKYWLENREVIKNLKLRIWDLRCKGIARDVAVAIYRMHWNILLTDRPKPIGGENRVTAIFRKTAEGWKFIHYVEAAMTPTVYVRGLLEKNVDEGF